MKKRETGRGNLVRKSKPNPSLTTTRIYRSYEKEDGQEETNAKGKKKDRLTGNLSDF